jgi:hypothetical protein
MPQGDIPVVLICVEPGIYQQFPERLFSQRSLPVHMRRLKQPDMYLYCANQALRHGYDCRVNVDSERRRRQCHGK